MVGRPEGLRALHLRSHSTGRLLSGARLPCFFTKSWASPGRTTATRETEGQTFHQKSESECVPDFLSVYDDPRCIALNGVSLAGSYSHDDEGVPAQRVS